LDWLADGQLALVPRLGLVVDLDRQEIHTRGGSRLEPPQRVPESNPPVLGDWFIYLSVVVLICGVIAITALNFGSTFASPLVRIPALVGAGLLVPLSADAAVRSWRSAWAWLPVDRPRGLARFVWALVLGATFVACVVAVLGIVSS
jgi:hypothetical protein